jgi:hypothetical protein
MRWTLSRKALRYIPQPQEQSVREAVKGYRIFMMLAEKYADMVIRDTRKSEKIALPVSKNGKRKEKLKRKLDAFALRCVLTCVDGVC